MNKHKKLAIFVAPILILIGYIASDYYLEYQAQESQLFQLQPQGTCDVLNKQCVLSTGEFKLSVFDVEGVTTVNSTFPLDSIIFFIVDEKNQATTYPLEQVETAYYWNAKTPLRELVMKSANQTKLRVVAKVKGGQYISEFSTKGGF